VVRGRGVAAHDAGYETETVIACDRIRGEKEAETKREREIGSVREREKEEG